MSWIEQLSNVEVEIITGDGKRFKPLWKEAKRSKNYNTSAYNFINVAGTLIDRQLPEGYQYDTTIIFQGESHLAVSDEFQMSADDRRFWTIIHPYWGEIMVQPMSIEEDKTVLNITAFKIKVWETISSDYPIQKQLSNDRVAELNDEVNEMAAQSFEAQIPELDTEVRAALMETVEIADVEVTKLMKLSEDFAKFKGKVSAAKARINDATQSAIDVMRTVQAVINYPVQVIQSVKDRIAVAMELKNKLTAIFFRKASKKDLVMYESIISGVVAMMATSAIDPGEEDYQLRTEIVETVDNVRTSYEDYLMQLDNTQSTRSDDVDGFTPDPDVSNALNAAIMEALANVYDYSFGAKQERIIMLEEDSNPILLTHRFYGLDANDDNLAFFIRTNALSLDELFEVRKGRRISYFV